MVLLEVFTGVGRHGERGNVYSAAGEQGVNCLEVLKVRGGRGTWS